MKKNVSSELIYILANLVMALSVALLSALDMGLSMIVAPAFLLSQKIGVTFGQAEYIVQAFVFILLCLVMKKFRVSFIFAFITCLFYGAVLDLIQLIPILKTGALSGLSIFAKVPLFLLGITMTSLAVCLHFRTYLFPQVHDFFVMGVTTRYNLNKTLFKWCTDIVYFIISVCMSFAFFGFGTFNGIGWGTLIMALYNGPMIGLLGKCFDKFFTTAPKLTRFSTLFTIENVRKQTE